MLMGHTWRNKYSPSRILWNTDEKIKPLEGGMTYPKSEPASGNTQHWPKVTTGSALGGEFGGPQASDYPSHPARSPASQSLFYKDGTKSKGGWNWGQEFPKWILRAL